MDSSTESKKAVEGRDKARDDKKRCNPSPSTGDTLSKKLDHKYEFFVEWDEYKSSSEKPICHSVKATEETHFSVDTATFEQNEVDEWNCRSFSLCLKQVDTDLATLAFMWWQNSQDASLMNFNQSKQDLADFCYSLWEASGRNKHAYDGCDIEMGESMYSHTEVNELIAEVFPEDDLEEVNQVTYLANVYPPLPTTGSDHGRCLLEKFVAMLGTDCNIIAYASDLDKLGVNEADRTGLGFRRLKYGMSYIRVASPYETVGRQKSKSLNSNGKPTHSE